MSGVRPARPADRRTLVRLQRHLRDPAPDLLDYGLAAGGILVSGDGTPVAYLVAAGVTFDGSTFPADLPPETGGRRGPREADVPSEASDAPVTPGGGTGSGSGGTTGSDSAHLAELAVAPGHRRAGHATRLVERLLAETDGPVTVAVAPENDAARALYRSLGFECVERREGYFPSGPALWLVAQ